MSPLPRSAGAGSILWTLITLPGLTGKFSVTGADVRKIAEHYLRAVQEAGRICRHIAGRKAGGFAVEVSMDETAAPQTPVTVKSSKKGRFDVTLVERDDPSRKISSGSLSGPGQAGTGKVGFYISGSSGRFDNFSFTAE
jgi:hypothetical protein